MARRWSDLSDRSPRRRWSDLSERTRRLLITAAVADCALRVTALIDIKRRPASQTRGQKRVWAAAVAIISSAGVLPISYFVFGRRRHPDPTPRTGKRKVTGRRVQRPAANAVLTTAVDT